VIKNVTFIMDDIRFGGRIAWALIKGLPLLLGRMDVFNKFRIAFDREKESTIFDPSPQI